MKCCGLKHDSILIRYINYIFLKKIKKNVEISSINQTSFDHSHILYEMKKSHYGKEEILRENSVNFIAHFRNLKNDGINKAKIKQHI